MKLKLPDYYIDTRTGRVKKCLYIPEDPEVARLNRKRAVKAKAKRKADKLARRRNRK
jgi:hypothetical protein